MSDHFVVEADRRVVGVAVRVPGGFKFFSSVPECFKCESRTFPKERTMMREITRAARNEPGACGPINDNLEFDGGPPPSAA